MDEDDEDTLKPEYVLVNPPAQLSPDVIQRYKRYGLAVVDSISGMEIDCKANFWDIEEMLRSLFPPLFDWFDGLPEVEANLDKDIRLPNHLPQWLLCNKLPGRSSGVCVAAGVAFPTGSDIEFNVQTKRSGFKENILILSECVGSFISSLEKLDTNILYSDSLPHSKRNAQYVTEVCWEETSEIYPTEAPISSR